MPLTDIQAAELTNGKHYHAWALMPMPYTMLATGRTMTTLAYAAAKYPYANRQTARRHAKSMGSKIFGPSGYMALLCGGGDACPFLLDPWVLLQNETEEGQALRAAIIFHQSEALKNDS